MKRRILSIFMTLCMLLTLLPVATYAENTQQAVLGTQEISIPAGQSVVLEFTPEEDGMYRFYTTGSYDTYGTLLDAYGNCLSDVDDNGEDTNFLIKKHLTAGETYRICVHLFDGDASADVQLVVGLYDMPTSGSCGENLTWALSNDGTLTISGTGPMTDYNCWDTPWYDSREFISDIIIEDGVTSIGSNAFSDCFNLAAVTIADSVTSIGDRAFSSCSNLSSVTLPDGVASIGYGAFEYSGLASILIPANVANMQNRVFAECLKLRKVIFLGDALIYDSMEFAEFFFDDSLTAYYPAGNSTWTDEVTQSYNACYITWQAYEAGEHIYDIYTVPSTCTEDGMMTKTCLLCGEIQTETIPAIDHSYAFVMKYDFYDEIRQECAICGEPADGQASMAWDTVTLSTLPDCNTKYIAFSPEQDGYYRFGVTAERDVYVELSSCHFLAGSYNLNPLAEIFYPNNSVITQYLTAGDTYMIAVRDYNEGSIYSEYDASNIVTLTAEQFTPPTSGSCGENATWSISDGTLTISGFGDMDNYDEQNSAPWTPRNSTIENIVIENGITSIGVYSFIDMFNLTSVVMPDSVQHIGYQAFSSCTCLTDITLSKGLKSLDFGAFMWCSSLSSISIPASTEYIDERVFSFCDSLLSITVDAANDNYCSVDGVLFNKAKTTLIQYPLAREGDYIIPNGVTTIGKEAFRCCKGLTAVTCPESLTTIEDDAFYACDNLSSVTFSDGLTSIGNSAFFNTKLETVIIPASVTHIGYDAFYWCDWLAHIVFCGDMPEGADIISWDSRTSFYYPADTGNWTEDGRMTLSSSANWLPYTDGHPYRSAVTSPTCTQDGFTSHICLICGERYVDSYVSALGHCYAPVADSGHHIENCCTLCGLTAADNVGLSWSTLFISIPKYSSKCVAFSPAESGYYRFYSDYYGTYMYLSDDDFATLANDSSISEYLMAGKIYYLEVSDNSPEFDSEQDNVLMTLHADQFEPATSGACGEDASWKLDDNGALIISGTGNIMYDGTAPWYALRNSVKTVVIGSGITSIPEWAFHNCSNLLTVSISDSVTEIGYAAFEGTPSLTSFLVDAENPSFCSLQDVLYNKDVTEIVCYPHGREGAYVMPETITRLDNQLSFCSELTSVTLNSQIHGLWSIPFGGCYNLQSIYVDADNNTYSSINGALYSKDGTQLWCVPNGREGNFTVAEGTESINHYAFYGDDKLTAVSIPEGVTSIGIDAFINCNNLCEINIPSSVTYIGNFAFRSCHSLQEINIPNSNADIRHGAFDSCSHLRDVTLPSDATAISGGMFCGCSSLGSISIPESVVTIEYYAFKDCSSLTSITIPENVQFIGFKAFANCSALDSVFFAGDAPSFGAPSAYASSASNGVDQFENVTAMAYYPADNATWTDDVMQDYGGNITWVPYAAGEHVWRDVVTAPTCTEQGYTTHICGICGESYVDSYVPATPHSFAPLYDIDDDGDISNHVSTRCTICGAQSDAPMSTTWTELPLTVSTNQFYPIAFTAPQDGYYCFHADGYSDVGILVYAADDTYIDDATGSVVCHLKAGQSYEIDVRSFTDEPQIISYTLMTEPNEPATSGTCGENLTWQFTDGVLTISGTGEMASFSTYEEVPWRPLHLDITSAIIEDGVTSISCYAFADCYYLEEVSIPNSVTLIKDNAFACCGLRSVYIPASVTEINSGAFFGANVSNFYVDEANPTYSTDGYSLLSKDGTTLFAFITPTDVYAIPNGVTTISFYAFEFYPLERITIPASVTEIKPFAFAYCRELREIEFLGDAPVIDQYAFDDDTLTAYYPADNDTWTSDVMVDYGNCNITWLPSDGLPSGDIDGDGLIQTDDLVLLTRHVAKIEEITDESTLQRLDYNGDGIVDASDLTVMAADLEQTQP